MVVYCLEDKVDPRSSSVKSLSVLSPDVFLQESYVPVRSTQDLSFSLGLCIYFYLELLHSVPLSSRWIQIYPEDILEVICSVKPSLPLSAEPIIFWPGLGKLYFITELLIRVKQDSFSLS